MRILPTPDRVSPELIEAVMRVDPASIGHFAEFGFMDLEIRALWSSPKVAGRALTVRTPAMDNTMIHRAIELVQPGDLLVIQRGQNRTHAGVGGGLAYAARSRGAVAIVVDGVATDLQEIVEYKVPVYARGLSNLTTKMLGLGGDINVPVAVGGVAVMPGDLVVCDANGVLVLNPEEAWEYIRLAEAAEARWPEIKAKLDQGQTLTAISGSLAIIEAQIPALLRDVRSGRRKV